MADIQYTPVTLWEGFDKTDVETEVNAVKIRRSGYLTIKSLFFWGSAKGLQIFPRASDRPPKSRVFAEYCRLSKKAPDNSMPALLIISEPGRRADFGLMRRMAKQGYAVLWPDLDGGAGGGEGSDTLNSTRYSPEAAHARYEKAASTGFAFKDPKASCWYEWGAVVMRAVTVLSAFPEVDPSKIGVIAVGRAAGMAGMAGYRDERINRICLLFGDMSVQNYKDEYMQKQYAASLSFRAYAQHIKCPVLYMGATNESSYDMNEACEVFSKVPPSTGSSLSLSERLDHEIGFRQSGNIQAWFDGMRQGLSVPQRPVSSFRVSDDKLYCVFNAPEQQALNGVKVFFSYGGCPMKMRDWLDAPMQEMGKGEYVAKLAAYEQLPVHAFVTAEYGDGLMLSTRIISKDPAELDIPKANPDKRRLIYSTENGAGNFTTVNNNLVFHRAENVVMREGPLGLSGVSAGAGCLAAYILSDCVPGARRRSGDTLLIDMAADAGVNVKITLRDAQGMEYAAEVYVKQGLWQKVPLEAKQFKTPGKLPLQAFDRPWLLYFKAARRIYIRSMLWT